MRLALIMLACLGSLRITLGLSYVSTWRRSNAASPRAYSTLCWMWAGQFCRPAHFSPRVRWWVVSASTTLGYVLVSPVYVRVTFSICVTRQPVAIIVILCAVPFTRRKVHFPTCSAWLLVTARSPVVHRRAAAPFTPTLLLPPCPLTLVAGAVSDR